MWYNQWALVNFAVILQLLDYIAISCPQPLSHQSFHQVDWFFLLINICQTEKGSYWWWSFCLFRPHLFSLIWCHELSWTLGFHSTAWLHLNTSLPFLAFSFPFLSVGESNHLSQSSSFVVVTADSGSSRFSPSSQCDYPSFSLSFPFSIFLLLLTTLLLTILLIINSTSSPIFSFFLSFPFLSSCPVVVESHHECQACFSLSLLKVWVFLFFPNSFTRVLSSQSSYPFIYLPSFSIPCIFLSPPKDTTSSFSSEFQLLYVLSLYFPNLLSDSLLRALFPLSHLRGCLHDIFIVDEHTTPA